MTPVQHKIVEIIRDYVGAPSSKEILRTLKETHKAATLHGLQVELSDLSMHGVVRRSKRGLYRLEFS